MQELLNKVYELEIDGKHRETSLLIVKFIQECLQCEDFESIDNCLQQADTSILTGYSLIAFVRGSYVCRNKLKNWEIFLQKTKFRLLELGKEPEKILVGLNHLTPP